MAASYTEIKFKFSKVDVDKSPLNAAKRRAADAIDEIAKRLLLPEAYENSHSEAHVAARKFEVLKSWADARNKLDDLLKHDTERDMVLSSIPMTCDPFCPDKDGKCEVGTCFVEGYEPIESLVQRVTRLCTWPWWCCWKKGCWSGGKDDDYRCGVCCFKGKNFKGLNFILGSFVCGLFTLGISLIVFIFVSNGGTKEENIYAWLGAWKNAGDTSDYCSGDRGPDEFVAFKTYYAGLVLGLVFGFLDNWGLFFGMSNIEQLSRSIGWSVVAALYRGEKGEEPTEKFIKINKIATDFDAGFGNTFSDLLGVMLGTAAMQSTAAGLGVRPDFWPFDLLSFFIGCLMGVLLPGLQSNADSLNVPRWQPVLAQVFIAAAIVLLAIPSCWNSAGYGLISTSVALLSASILWAFWTCFASAITGRDCCYGKPQGTVEDIMKHVMNKFPTLDEPSSASGPARGGPSTTLMFRPNV